MDGTVLVADDDRTIRTVLTQALTRAGCRVHATASMVTLMRWVEEGKGDLVISDVIMPDGNGLEQLPRIGRARPGLPVIVISAQNTIMTAIRAAEAEAFDYLPKPFDLPDLLKRAARALETRRRAPAPQARDREPGAESDLPLVGRTPAMQALYRLVARVMNTALPVLITGESGTGKSLVARAVHDFSDRRTLPFVVLSAADLPQADALSHAAARAKGGSLLFDEVADWPEDAQARAARLIDTLGTNGPRLLSTTKCDLQALIEAGKFREDLYYRLSGVTLAVPPLRDRVDDVPPLAEHALTRAERDGLPARRLSQGALDLLRAYTWPGNVRQLEHVIRRLAATATGDDITRAEVEAAIGAQSVADLPRPSAGGERLSVAVARHLRRYFDLHGATLPPAGLYDRILAEVEIPLIEAALDATGGNQARAADLLGINRNTLRKKITDHDIRVTRRRRLM
jgi:two-component system nitrogen regulation response regulator GlnG